MTSKVVIEVRGGVVQEVYCDDPEVEVVLIDWDTDEHPVCAVMYATTPMRMMPEATQAALESAS